MSTPLSLTVNGKAVSTSSVRGSTLASTAWPLTVSESGTFTGGLLGGFQSFPVVRLPRAAAGPGSIICIRDVRKQLGFSRRNHRAATMSGCAAPSALPTSA